MVDKNREKFQEIGQRIKKAREVKGLTQGRLGKKLSKPLTATAISLYESGIRDVGVDVLTEIAEMLDVKLVYLIKGYTKDESAPPIQVALRADKDLWNNQKTREQVLDFIEFVKKKTRTKNK